MVEDRYAPLWERLVRQGKLDHFGLERIRRLAADAGDLPLRVATRLGLVSEDDLAEAISVVSGFNRFDPAQAPAAPLFEQAINPSFLRSLPAVPLEAGEAVVRCALVDPFDQEALEALTFACGHAIMPEIATTGQVEAALGRLYPPEGGPAEAAPPQADSDSLGDDMERLRDLASEAPVIRLVNQLIGRAVAERASDIHIEPVDGDVRVRLRIDGALREVEALAAGQRLAVVSRIKILAKLNIAERRKAQDGRIRLAVRGQEIDLRVSTTPTIFGESVVLRILDRTQLALDYQALGFDAESLARFRDALERPHGIFLVTGPTGSGKTTTLYTALTTLNTPDRKILTVEDPVEYQLKGINQVQVKPQIGVTFANALRSFLRQDPDIMMIGEIRDLETAQIAVQAALTGHLILSTLHTNDAASAITRLLDMGLEDYLLTSTVNAIVGQRLVRTLCPHCKRAHGLPVDEALKLAFPEAEDKALLVYEPVGCAECGHSGYLGRTSILEILPVTEGIRQLVLQHAEAGQIRDAAIRQGMRSLYAHGMQKVAEGVTTVDEVLRVTREL